MRMLWVKIQFVILINVLRSGCEILTDSETPEREIYLQPRHFNPHPFESTNRVDRQIQPASTSIFNQGPIQFPPTNQDAPLGRPGHPYAAVALRNRQKSLQRFAGIDNSIHPTPYVPLARHPKKFIPDRRYDYEDDIYDDYSSHKKQYAFSYTVRDSATGDDFSHTQQQKDGTVRGSYKVHLPDGRIQIVRYHADDNGYHADVSYNEDKPLPPPPPPPPPRPTFNYLKGFHAADAPEGAQQRSFNYDLYIGQPVGSTPAPPAPTIPTYGVHSVPVPNVHIQSYNTGAEADAGAIGIVPTTPAPPPPIIQPTSYYVKSTTLPAPRISFISTTPASPYQDITVVGAGKLQASLNPYGARKATAIDPTGNYELGNSAPSSTYATNYDYDYDGGYKVLSSTEAAHQAHEVNNLDNNGVALYYQAEQ